MSGLSTQAPPPPPSDSAIPDSLSRWLYLVYAYIITITNGGSSGEFGTPGVNEPDKALVPNDSKSLDYLNLGELSLDGISVDSTSTEINQLHSSSIRRSSLSSLQSYSDSAHSLSIVIDAQVGINIAATIQFYNADGNSLASPVSVTAYLSDNPDGAEFTIVAPSNGISAGLAGYIYKYDTASIVVQLISDPTGQINIDISEVSIGTWYLVIIGPYGKLTVSSPIVFV